MICVSLNLLSEFKGEHLRENAIQTGVERRGGSALGLSCQKVGQLEKAKNLAQGLLANVVLMGTATPLSAEPVKSPKPVSTAMLWVNFSVLRAWPPQLDLISLAFKWSAVFKPTFANSTGMAMTGPAINIKEELATNLKFFKLS
jgi:hypothetical protein